MKTSISLLLLFILLIGTSNIFAGELYVNAPRSSFKKYPASIRNMTIKLEPHGSYVSAGIWLTFSPDGSPYKSVTDTLESVFSFELESRAFINDMWLYMDEWNYVRAMLIDKWTAGFIYEEIVSRMRDPSIFSNSAMGNIKSKYFQ